MKKLFVHLSVLCLLAALMVPMVGCNRNEGEVEESPATTETTTMMEEPATTTEPMDTGMTTTDMGTDAMTSEPATTTP